MAINIIDCYPIKMKAISLRKNASQASIAASIEALKAEWHKDAENAEVIDVFEGQPILELPGTYYLEIGGAIRWGYRGGFWAWGFNKSHVDREIAGQREYAARN